MLRRSALMLALAALAVTSVAQEAAAPASGMPTIQEPPPAQAGQETGLMGGEKPFYLTTDVDGELIYNFDEETNELDSVSARKGVVFSSEDMTLNADQLDYRNKTAQLTATGKKVVVRQGEIIATCQLFKYNAETEQSELSGNPIVYNKTRDGKVTKTGGDKVIFYRVNGKPQVKVMGGTRAPRLDSGQSVPNATSVIPPAAPAGAASMQSFDDPAPGPGGPLMSGNSQVLGTETGTTSDASASTGSEPSALGLPTNLIKTPDSQ